MLMFVRIKLIVTGLLVSFILAFGSTGFALTIELTDTGGVEVGTNARSGFEEAAALWESVFVDPVTVRLDVGFQSLGSGILGSTGSEKVGAFYSDIGNALNADQTTVDDLTAVTNLQAGDFLDFLTTNEFGNSERDNDTGFGIGNENAVNNRSLDVNRANAKALGLLSDDGATDGSITFSNSFSWDFDSNDGISGGAFDFVGIAAHEIGHALGFVSGVDTVDLTFGSGPFSGVNLDVFRVFSVLDLYRYSAASTALGILDLSVGGNPYFSIDKGLTNLGAFSTGRFNGDGRQASHWKDNRGLGIMDPTAGTGEFLQISGLDLRAFDVMGWDFSIGTAEIIPEPATLWLLGIGLAGLWGIYFRKRSKSPETRGNHSGIS